MHGLDFSSVGFHAASSLTRLDISPDHWGHVALVVHEAGVEVRCLVWVWRHNVRRSTREGVFQEVKHCEELAWWHNHVVTEPASNDRVVHNWLVGFVLEVRVPARAELLAGPTVHHLEFFLSRADLHTSFNAIGCEWASAVDVPLLEDLLLHLGITTNKVDKRLYMWLRAVCGERQAMDMSDTLDFSSPDADLLVILEVETNTRKVDQGLHTSLSELLWVTNTGALKNEW